jgi:hypothetical protein
VKKSRFFLGFISISVLHWMLNAVVYGVLLGDRFDAVEHLSKEPMNMVLFPVQSLLYGLLFVTLFARGFTPSKPRMRQGVLFGFLAGAFVAFPAAIANYATFSFCTLALAIQEAAATLGVAMILGVIVGRVYK